jgi:hypothetical protein
MYRVSSSAYGMPRMAFYTMGLQRASEPGKPPTFAAKLGIASAAGAAASIVGVPADVVMVRKTCFHFGEKVANVFAVRQWEHSHSFARLLAGLGVCTDNGTLRQGARCLLSLVLDVCRLAGAHGR